MADAIGSFLNFDSGISRVIWDAPFRAGDLPERQQLAPSEVAAIQQLDRLLQADNIDSAVARSLRPSVGSAEVLRPEKFVDALKAAGEIVGRSVVEGANGAASGEGRRALEGLDKVLKEQAELQAALDYYRDMLIPG